jgi:uncharacterized damage-inducible protein DinB
VVFSPGKFTVGDIARHIAATKRYMFAENFRGNQSRYAGCGNELADGYDEIIMLMERLHRESAEIIFRLPDLNAKCKTPDGASISIWKWMREHEIHHRGQIYVYLAVLEVPTPPLYGLTSEQVMEFSRFE